MNPKEYIKKFNLEEGWDNQVREQFLAELTIEFLSYLEVTKALNNSEKFNKGVFLILNKWEAISIRVPYGLPNGVWNYYTTILDKIHKELLIADSIGLECRQEDCERFLEISFQKLFGAISYSPVASFQTLGLTLNATADEIKSKYKELAVRYSPDQCDSIEKLMEITEAKNKCLIYLLKKV